MQEKKNMEHGLGRLVMYTLRTSNYLRSLSGIRDELRGNTASHIWPPHTQEEQEQKCFVMYVTCGRGATEIADSGGGEA